MYFAENLKFLRQRRRKSQAGLALSLNLTRTTLSGYEKNVQPPFRILIKIAEYFNISLDALIRRFCFSGSVLNSLLAPLRTMRMYSCSRVT